ncbi:Spore Coat Protein U domain protein [compost metagenome]
MPARIGATLCRRLLPLCLLGGGMLAPCLEAATQASFQVSATIAQGCEINAPASFGTIDFGTYPTNEQRTVDAEPVWNAELRLACTPGVNLRMRVDGGQNSSGDRRMRLGASNNYLAYALYSDAARTNAIPVNSDIPVVVSENIQLPVHGRLLLDNTAKAAGTYTDILTVTLTW